MPYEIDYERSSITIELPLGHELEISFSPDEDVSPPWEEYDGYGTVKLFDNGRELSLAFDTMFPSSRKAYEALIRGQSAVDLEGNRWMAIEAYIHSGEVWGLPGSMVVDRQWDVVEIRALWSPCKDCTPTDTSDEALAKVLKGCIGEFNNYLSGAVYFAKAALVGSAAGDESLEIESCGWLSGEAGLQIFADEAVESALAEIRIHLHARQEVLDQELITLHCFNHKGV